MNRGGQLRNEGRWNLVRSYAFEENNREYQKLDIMEFSGDDFKPEACMNRLINIDTKLHNNNKSSKNWIDIRKAIANVPTEEGVKNFLNSLKESKEMAAIDLQRNVYKNYNEFLESDMLVLRGLLNELRNVSDNLRDDGSESGPVPLVTSEPIVHRGRNKPANNSGADQRSLQKARIQALWDGVEGAQAKYSNVVEISFSTNKPKHPVHLFLLNDCLLIAVKKKRQGTSKAKLVADRCWGLDDISLIDMKDTDEQVNFFKILKHPTDQFIFQASETEEKKNLFSLSKRATEEMMSSKAAKHAVLRELSAGDFREIEQIGDQLEVHMATRDFEEAVETKNILSNVSSDPSKLDAIRTKMENRVVRLSRAISRDLTNPDVKKSQARELFLVARSENIRLRTKQLKFEGDIPQYINELSLVYFTLIKNTCDWYNAAFRDMRMASGLVKWAQEEMEHYANMFRRQVYSLHVRDEIIVNECLRYSREHSQGSRIGL
ncbi:2585_t:CDS:10 [Diversispora eburnea]|uniref:Exocyst complex component EXO84 n=1 Tax=Diversispora eburnea TaxID=1213867 RepID=A0A9N9BA32_9GLOM|nr:2585_t:CDS:10 [Diversispora eburnea]